MNKNYYLLTSLFFLIACGTENNDASQENATQNLEVTNQDNADVPDTSKTMVVENPETIVEEVSIEPQRNPLEELLANENAVIEYAPFDDKVITNDTTVTFDGEEYQLSYETSCLNDKRVVQQLFVLDDTNTGNRYLVTHNYKTIITIEKDGQTLVKHTIVKDLFESKVDTEFLQKSILTHPDIMDIDEEKQLIKFAFMIGIPSTDWLVVATLDLNRAGNLNILSVEPVAL